MKAGQQLPLASPQYNKTFIMLSWFTQASSLSTHQTDQQRPHLLPAGIHEGSDIGWKPICLRAAPLSHSLGKVLGLSPRALLEHYVGQLHSKKQLEDDDAEAEDISLLVVRKVEEDFGRHIEKAA